MKTKISEAEDAVIRREVDVGTPLATIAAKIGCNYGSLCRYCRLRGISTPRNVRSRSASVITSRAASIRQAIADQGRSIQSVAWELDVHYDALRDYCAQHGIVRAKAKKKSGERIPCLRCKKPFKSWDVRRNRFCRDCNKYRVDNSVCGDYRDPATAIQS